MQLSNLKEFINMLVLSEDNDCIDIVGELIVSAGKYIELTCEIESAVLVGKYTKDINENIKYIKGLRSKTMILKEEFKNNLKIINRLCNKDSIPNLYNGDIEEDSQLKTIAINLISNLNSV